MKPKIIFVEPMGKTNVFSSYMNLPLMGPIYLATILKNNGYDATVYNENILGRKVNDRELEADILCVGGLTSTIKRGYEIAQQFKSKNPKGKVIIGGIHASFMREEAAQYADHVVSGEAEEIILGLIKGKKEKFIQANHIDVNNAPIPDFSVLVNSKNMNITPVIASRGCPFNCNFCSVTNMFGKKFRTKASDKVIDELRQIKNKWVFFYDDNFTANKAYSYELLDKIKQENFNFRWFAQVRVDAAKDVNLIKKMSDAGCNQVYIGFESINPKTLKLYNKGQNVDDIKNSVKIFQDYGIRVHGMFMFGSDEDDKSVFRRTTDFCNDYEINSAQFLLLTPLPGTELFNKFDKEKRLLHKDWDYYDAMHTVFKPKNMSALALQNGAIDSFKEFYSYTKMTNEAFNVMADMGFRTLKSLYSNVRMKNYIYNSFFRVTIRAVGKSIVNKWINQNKGYLQYLSKC